jgi:predicted transcriptional regulator
MKTKPPLDLAGLRHKLEMTQREMSEATKMHPTEISRLENKDCKFSHLKQWIQTIDPNAEIYVAVKKICTSALCLKVFP